MCAQPCATSFSIIISQEKSGEYLKLSADAIFPAKIFCQIFFLNVHHTPQENAFLLEFALLWSAISQKSKPKKYLFYEKQERAL